MSLTLAPVAARPAASPRRLVVVLGITQTVGYGAMTMAAPVLITPMARDLGVPAATVAVGTTIQVLVGAVVAVPVGRLLDRHGGRWAMTGGSLLGVLAVLGWSQVTNAGQYYAVAVLIGVALAVSTYEAAFAVIVATVGRESRDSTILRLTLVTAFTSAFYYPLTGALEAWAGWRHTLVILAGLMVLAVPLHFWVVPDRRTHAVRVPALDGVTVRVALRQAVFWLLSTSFVLEAAAQAGVMMILVAHLRDAGHPPRTAATLPLLIGVLAVPIRLLLGRLARRYGMTLVSAAGFAVQTLGAVLLWARAGSLGWAALGVAFFGFGVGVATIARPAIVADRWGAARFAGILAALMVPIALARAAAPLLATALPFATALALATVVSAVAAVILLGIGLAGA